MRLTKKELHKITDSLRITISPDTEEELLAIYGDYAVDDKGQIFEYTDQDIYEQLRRILT